MQITKVEIKKECRKVGDMAAFHKAIEHIVSKYFFTLQAEENKDKTIIIKLEIEK